MWQSLPGFVAAALTTSVCLGSELTAIEERWLTGAWPVVTYAREAGFPLDIVVQPQEAPGAAPLALGFVDGRCKLVLTMRGNPEAQAILDRIEPDLMPVTLELMAAHELGHCKRYLDGAWLDGPAGFAARLPDALAPELRAAYLSMMAVRREEAYGDLVGLAWTQQRHPRQYARLHAWLSAERAKDRIPDSHHDTLVWVRLARDGLAPLGPSIFARAHTLWAAGLAADDQEPTARRRAGSSCRCARPR